MSTFEKFKKLENMIKIKCKNNGEIKNFPEGVSYLDIYKGFNLNLQYTPMCVLDCNSAKRLNERAFSDTDVEFKDVSSTIGYRIYKRGLAFIFAKAVADLFPGGTVEILNALTRSTFCPVHIGRRLTQEDVINVNNRMKEIVTQDIPFVFHKEHSSDVIKVLENAGRIDAARLMETLGSVYNFYYTIDDMADCFFGILPPSARYIDKFNLSYMEQEQAILIQIPDGNDHDVPEQATTRVKMFEVFQEYHSWLKIMGISTLGELNVATKRGESTTFINVAEALQSKKIVHIADTICKRRDTRKPLKIVLIAGPSSSGKTTFSKRLQIQLMANGVFPKVISMDDYFLDRDKMPIDENGEYDFEALTALDLEYFNQQLTELLDGNMVSLPTYNFKTGLREFSNRKLSVGDNDILIIEGIHALNPSLSPDIPRDYKFMIYVSALTSISIDDHNYISPSDNRLLRRILRDYKYRGTSARETIARWSSVKAGEKKWILPFQENADVMFNSAMLFEIAVIKDMILPILSDVPENCPEFTYAETLKKFLSLFVSIPGQKLPPTSLIREFIGGSSFHY